MNFKELLLRAKEKDFRSLEECAFLYKPMLIKESIVNGVLDEDLYQELWLIFIDCISKIKV